MCAQIVSAARSVILASGTLSPVQSLCRQLLPWATTPSAAPSLLPSTGSAPTAPPLHNPPAATETAAGSSTGDSPTICHFSCGHIVQSSRLLCLAVGQGPTGLPLELGHRTRGQAAMLDEVARLLLNVCLAVPQVLPSPPWRLLASL